jgi:hypothetical protein
MERSDIDSSEALSPKGTAGGQDQMLKTEIRKGRACFGEGRDLAVSADFEGRTVGDERNFPGRFAKVFFSSEVAIGIRRAESGTF